MRMKKIKLLLAQMVLLIMLFPFAAQAEDSNAMPVNNPGFAQSLRQQFVNFVYTTVNDLRYSVYQFGGNLFDTARGVYAVDCSGYVDRVLQVIYPEAYSSLVNSSGAEQPNSRHYYDFFKKLSSRPDDYWDNIQDVSELQAGDVLVFRTNRHHHASGHVMLVMDKPIIDENICLVKVADSAPSGHTGDTRHCKESGIGIGTLLLKINTKTGKPAAYAWKVGSCWKKNVAIVMARPVVEGA